MSTNEFNIQATSQNNFKKAFTSTLTPDEIKSISALMYSLFATADKLAHESNGFVLLGDDYGKKRIGEVLSKLYKIDEYGSGENFPTEFITRTGNARNIFRYLPELNMHPREDNTPVPVILRKLGKEDLFDAVDFFKEIYNYRENRQYIEACKESHPMIYDALVAYNLYYKQGLELAFDELDHEKLMGAYEHPRDFKDTNVFMDGASNVGQRRTNNEDRYTILEHPENPQMKLLAVADGCGGHEHGEEAAEMVINGLENWFTTLDVTYYSRTNSTLKSLIASLENINENLRQYNLSNHSNAASTVTVAVVLKNKTIIVNLGDSRCYASHKGELKQITEDHSVVWQEYLKGALTKEEMKTHGENNVILAAMAGIPYDTEDLDIKIINNQEYDSLLLFTDGVTDLLSDDKIKFINNEKPADEIVETLINEAVNVQQYAPCYDWPGEKEPLITGKDNATAVLLKKRV